MLKLKKTILILTITSIAALFSAKLFADPLDYYKYESEYIIETDQTTDTDGDGIPDLYDNCPKIPAPSSSSGCIEAEESSLLSDPIDTGDNDGDGIVNWIDHCPNEAGTRELNGCPKRTVWMDYDINARDDNSDILSPPGNTIFVLPGSSISPTSPSQGDEVAPEIETVDESTDSNEPLIYNTDSIVHSIPSVESSPPPTPETDDSVESEDAEPTSPKPTTGETTEEEPVAKDNSIIEKELEDLFNQAGATEEEKKDLLNKMDEMMEQDYAVKKEQLNEDLEKWLKDMRFGDKITNKITYKIDEIMEKNEAEIDELPGYVSYNLPEARFQRQNSGGEAINAAGTSGCSMNIIGLNRFSPVLLIWFSTFIPIALYRKKYW